MPRLENVLAGAKRAEAQVGSVSRTRLPITIDIMESLQRVWLGEPQNPDRIMLWAAACAGFFGFLRAREFTVPSAEAYDPSVHLNLSDLALDNHSNPTMVQLRIKQSKTDPFRQGVNVYLGKTATPVDAIIRYTAVGSSDPGPIFITNAWTPPTRAYLVSNLKAALSREGLDNSLYNGHSFRIGAATTAAAQGLEDSLIQMLGRWRSDAYKVYIKLPRSQLASVSQTLVRINLSTSSVISP